jgi:cation diffusion facilitator family transporter
MAPDHATSIVRAERTAAAATGATLLLVALKGVIGVVTGSAALIADAAHSAADLFALGASWAGLRLARRTPSARFPYGFYRAETLATLLVAVVILYLGLALLIGAAGSFDRMEPLSQPWLAVGCAIASIVTGIVLAIWEKRVSRATGSQSLAATADEAAMDAVSSVIVLVALLADVYAIPYVTGVATVLISLAVLRVGAYHGWLSVLALMDASVDPELEKAVTGDLLEIPEVRSVHKLRARRSGPYYFIEAHLHVAGSMDVMQSHAISHHAETTIRGKYPRVEAMTLHMEPYQSAKRRVLVPVDSGQGMDSEVSSHFGRAPTFLLVAVDSGEVTHTIAVANPLVGRRSRVGLGVVKRFVRKQDTSVALVREIGEIAFHALEDSTVEICRVSEGTAAEAVKDYLAGNLEALVEPTHALDESTD